MEIVSSGSSIGLAPSTLSRKKRWGQSAYLWMRETLRPREFTSKIFMSASSASGLSAPS